jgi:hypothetical protein
VTRDFKINGETLCLVKGNPSSLIGTLSELGLSADPIRVRFDANHTDLKVNAWGDAPPEVQVMLGAATITMGLVHFDQAVLEACITESLGGGGLTFGQVARAGTRLGNNCARFAPNGTINPATGLATTGNHYIGLNLTSPVLRLPYRFWYAYMTGPVFEYTLGAEATVAGVQFRAIPYVQDPYGGSPSQPLTVYGTGAQNAIIWDRTLDT